MASAGPLPTFLIIGSQKSGTRWLKSNLSEHPDVFVAAEEPGFFHDPDRMRSLGTDWYRSQFEERTVEAAVGEGTPGYMIWHHRTADIAERIDQLLPGAKLIAMLRNPVDRAESAFRHFQKWGDIPQDADLMTMVRDAAASGALDAQPPDAFIQGWGGPQTLVTGGWYGRSLQPYVERFGLERFGGRLQIIFHDDVLADPIAAYRSALEHLDVDPAFVPRDLEARVFTNAKKQRRWSSTKASGPSPQERAELLTYFEEDLALLEQLCGRDLRSWRSP